MRLAIIADIHEDIINLKKAFEKIQRLKCDDIICLGDISGFSVLHHDFFDSRNASECLKMVRENCTVIIAGNHDLHAARHTPKISSYEYPSNWYELDFQDRLIKSMDQVWLYEHEELSALYSHEEKTFISNLPEYKVKTYEDLSVLFSHFIFPNLTGSEQRFYFELPDFDAHKRFMTEQGGLYSFSGHRHYPGLMVISDSKVIRKNFNRKYKLKAGDVIMVPPIVRAMGNGGLCVYDINENTVEAIRI
ncbi:MAG TPA: metallophosphoesterase [Salinivirga sp.]|uniref:metallophosphoesterase family protein n=1 Tax=Salinivirga sp. TaxID=1970192 RepID=UPI002B46BF22|nr:metallophosphoesterase [Salinivirga sp.]HKK60737.1 metallophosphoesterase [Salinivirga sp.]